MHGAVSEKRVEFHTHIDGPDTDVTGTTQKMLRK